MQTDVHVKDSPLARFGTAIASFMERFFPDAFVFALVAVAVVFLFGLGVGETPLVLVGAFGDGFWSLVPFTMQMILVIVGGFVVASSRPCFVIIRRVAAWPGSPRSAVAFVALFSMTTSMVSWGFSLIFTGLLVRELVRRIDGLDFRAVGAAAYLGLGGVWALGLSSSAAMMMATPSAMPKELVAISGVIPLTQTIFLWQILLVAAVLIALSVTIAWFSCPSPANAKTAAMMGIHFDDPTVGADEATTPAERLERSPILTLFAVSLLLLYLGMRMSEKGALAALDLNNFNLAFIAFGMLLHWRPRSFLKAVASSVPATSGVLIQFPFYAGIFGLITYTSIGHVLSSYFASIATHDTYNVIVSIYSFVLGVFIPSGGGKWVVEAPYVMHAATELKMHLGWTVQTYNAAEALPNLLNPFFMLPLMGILNAKARDLVGYSILQLLFHAPVVIILCWLLAYTLPYTPPVMP
ncbi:MAG: short-chain fatty acid transporter [Acidobacteria bacterium]|nr:short-chain fatty acid transporter [Acidobacteriota bacterium]